MNFIPTPTEVAAVHQVRGAMHDHMSRVYTGSWATNPFLVNVEHSLNQWLQAEWFKHDPYTRQRDFNVRVSMDSQSPSQLNVKLPEWMEDIVKNEWRCHYIEFAKAHQFATFVDHPVVERLWERYHFSTCNVSIGRNHCFGILSRAAGNADRPVWLDSGLDLDDAFKKLEHLNDSYNGGFTKVPFLVVDLVDGRCWAVTVRYETDYRGQALSGFLMR